jgi:hypothetical protein
VSEALRRVLQQPDATGDLALPAELSAALAPAELAALEQGRLLVRDASGRALICDQCEEGCRLEPVLWERPAEEPLLVHVCVGSAGNGLLTFPVERLRRWRISGVGLAGFIHTALGLTGRPEERIAGRLWELGGWRRRGPRRSFYLGWGFGLPDGAERDAAAREALDGINPVLVVPHVAPPGDVPWDVLELTRLLLDEEGESRLDVDLAAHRLGRGRRVAVVKPFPVPMGATWERLSVTILGGDRAELRYGAQAEVRSYVEMGFADGRARPTEPRPSELWGLLLVLADEDGSMDWRSPKASPKHRDRIRDLRAKLSALFPIEGNPILDYGERRAYQTAFTLRRRAS